MTDKEALKLALDALESCTPLDTSSSHVIYPWYDEKLVDKAITALKERLADHPMREVQRLGQEIEQEPVCPECKAEVLYECVACSSNNYPPPQRTEQEPVSKLQEPTAERAWFTIAELNAWADKKLSENPHWVMPKDEPERDEPPPQPEQEPVAWRTFDGEGGYDYRTYDTNEDYADEWEKRNPNHKGWVEPLYKDPKPCPTCEALARTVMLDQTSHDTTPPQRTEQEPFGIWHQGATDEESDFYLYSESGDVSCPTCIKLYTTPPQRTWVGLNEEDYVLVNQLCINPIQAAEFVDRLLKERNQ
jgi:hypothetical protein